MWQAQAWREARKILLAQSVLAVAAALVCAGVWGWAGGGWALVGGLVCIGPSALLALRMTRAFADPNANFGATFAIGELLKVVLVAALFALVYAQGSNVHALALLLGFIAAVQGYFLALLFA